MDTSGRFLMGVALASGLVVSSLVGARALVRVKSDDTIQVAGSAKRRITSDLIVWSAKVSARGGDMKGAYQALAASVPKVKAYLEKKGVPAGQIVVDSVSTQVHHPRDKEGNTIEDQVTGYTMSQVIEVRSKEVEKIEKISREVTELINDDVVLESYAPAYHYTKLGDLKIEMVAEAARDARVRTEKIATATGARIGALRSARMGVLQINPAESTEVSAEGNNDTTSLEKDVIAVVGATFALE